MADVATMPSELNKRLLFRELGYKPAYSGIHGIYGDKAWVDDLDIVNELGGHTGCVNALRYARPSVV
jgi:nuclear receptor interaction protein